ncbi:AAA domain [Moorella glycerini]|uniref:Septum site-determining protein MinD n=1 Tax=Neomoorella stamsii TaxID=1266720 RepID=A0A9X7J0I2_9FIRM|nr:MULTISPECIES: P-loop NTPase [Moorella]PRR69669.1 Septum site-determining protein MinD [Moorella stamsii]CEP67161.1 AAA domain [Moorella glycerini]
MAGVATDLAAARAAAPGDGGVVVAGFPGNDGVELVKEMASRYLRSRFFLAVEDVALADTALWRQMAARGIVLVSINNTAVEVAAALKEAGFREAPAPLPPARAGEKPGSCPDERVKVSIAFWSTRGGVGKTALAVSLAALLALRGRKIRGDYRVALVDADADGGNLSYWLGCPNPRVTLPAWLDLPEGSVGWDTVREYLLRHEASGLYFLPRSARATDEEYITAGLMEKVHAGLSSYFDTVIYDLGTAIRKENNYTPYLLSTVDTILVVARPDLPTVQSIKNDLDELVPRWGLDPGRLRLVLNRRARGAGYKLGDIARHMGIPLLLPGLPEDIHVDRAADRGAPVVLAYPGCDFSREAGLLLANLMGREFADAGDRKRPWEYVAGLFRHRAAAV